MIRYLRLSALAVVFLCNSGQAVDAGAGTIDASEFEVESGLVDKIFNDNAKASNLELLDTSSGWKVSPSLSFFSPEKFILSNPYFDIDYSPNMQTLPSLRLAVAAPIARWKGLEIQATGRVSYSFRESLFSVRSKTGVSLTDSIRVHWLPASAGLTMEYEIPHFSFLKPSIGGGAGLQWIYQQGRLDGLEQGFWLPFSYFEAAITFFPSTDWFTGFRVGATLVQSFGDSQNVRGWSTDFGMQFRL